MKFFKKRTITARDILIQEINATREELNAAYSLFESVVDPDLISSSIYRINSIQDRYRYLMKQLKAGEVGK